MSRRTNITKAEAHQRPAGRNGACSNLKRHGPFNDHVEKGANLQLRQTILRCSVSCVGVGGLGCWLSAAPAARTSPETSQATPSAGRTRKCLRDSRFQIKKETESLSDLVDSGLIFCEATCNGLLVAPCPLCLDTTTGPATTTRIGSGQGL